MQISKVSFQSVEELSQRLLAEKASKVRFSLEMPERDVANGIYAGMAAIVALDGGKLIFDTDTKEHIQKAAKWLANAPEGNSLLLCGLYGNGKTTLAKAIKWLVEYVTEKELGFNKGLTVPIIRAKNFCKIFAGSEKSREDKEQIAKLTKSEILILDELGREPREVNVFGMPHTPVIDLLEDRYEARRTTIITTNLETPQIEEKYGPHIYDRFRETMYPIIFENESYRHQHRNP